MNTHADKTQENKSQSSANKVSQKRNNSESTFQFVDSRPEAIAQRKLHEMANNSSQVGQLRAFQEMANNTLQAKQATQLQAMADNYASQQQPIQKKENKTGLPDNLKSGNVTQKKGVVQRAWDNKKCPGMQDFNSFDPEEAVDKAPKTRPAFIQVHKTPRAKYDFTIAHFYLVPVEIKHIEFQVCVVAHAHLYGKDGRGSLVPGKTYIPGWSGWSIDTPPAFRPDMGKTKKSLIALNPHKSKDFSFIILGAFPGEQRYPQLTPKGIRDADLEAFI